MADIIIRAFGLAAAGVIGLVLFVVRHVPPEAVEDLVLILGG